MRIHLLRHGRTTQDGIYRGQVDVPLAPEGWQQMHQALRGLPLERVIASPLQRCGDFAQSLPEVTMQLDARLMEIDFGDWDGQDTQKVWQTNQAQVEAFWQDPLHVSPPNGENFQQVLQRAKAAFYEHVEQGIKDKLKSLLLISHAGVMRVLIGDILCMHPQGLLNINLPYASLVHLNVYQDNPLNQDISIRQPVPPHFNITVDMGGGSHLL